jgi:hypothetical protein
VHSFCCGGHVSGCHVAKSGEMEMAARILWSWVVPSTIKG